MSRETNSLLLRYNINHFWSNSISTPQTFYIKKQYNNFIKLFLSNYFLHPLKIQYTKNQIYIYIYYYKNEKYSFIQQFLFVKKSLFSKLILRKKYNIVQFQTNLQISNISSISKLLILIINYRYLSILSSKNNIKNIITLGGKFIYQRFVKLKIKKNKKTSLKRRIKNKIKLKYVNYLLKMKWLSLFIHLLINAYNKKIYRVTFKSIFDKNIFSIKYPYFFKYLKFIALKQKLFIIITGLFFFKCKVFNLYLNFLIQKTKNKKHIKNVYSFLQLIKIFFEKQIIPFSGLKFFMSGRLNGKLRKSSFGYKLGSLKLMTLNSVIDYSFDFVITQYGSISIKLWLSQTSNDKKTL